MSETVWAHRPGHLEGRRFQLRPVAYKAALAAGIAFVLIWATYCFDLTPLRHPTRMPEIELSNYVSPDSIPGQLADHVTTQVPLPMQSFFAGIFLAFMHFFAGHGAYQIAYGQFLLGEVKWDGGWCSYFPVALALKTTLPFLALMLLTLVSPWRKRHAAALDGPLFVRWAMVSILAVAISGSLNIGVRHVLPIYPLMAILASSAFKRNAGDSPIERTSNVAGGVAAGRACRRVAWRPSRLLGLLQ